MFRKKWQNFVAAIAATVYMWREELSFRIQVAIGIIAFALAYTLHISTTEWLFVILMVGAVFSVEALNTAIEEICDVFTSEHHPRVGIIKDLGALASAWTGLAALVIGSIIFLPKILALV